VAGFCKGELLNMITEDRSADKLTRFRAIWIVETFSSFLDEPDLKKILTYYGKVVTADPATVPKDQQESELIKAACVMAIFRYLSESDTDECPLTNDKVKEMTGLDVSKCMRLFLEYMFKYPELLEFPNGVQNLMTIFYQDIAYDLPLIR
jgi:hypothetical protein